MTPVEPSAILPFLKQLQFRHQIQSYIALVGGLLLCLVGPMLLTLCYLLISMTLISTYGFWGTYWLIAAISLPVFFLVAWKLRGSVLENTVSDSDSLSGPFMQRSVGPLLVIAEVATFGPRMVIWAIERIFGHRRVDGIGLGRIAQAVAEMTHHPESIPPSKLLYPGEEPKKLEPILAFLLYHDIVDLAKRSDRVWLTSEFVRRFDLFRKKLAASHRRR